MIDLFIKETFGEEGVPDFYTYLTAQWFLKIIRFACWICVMAGSVIVFTYEMKSELLKLSINTYTFVIENKSCIYTNFTPGLNNLRALNQRGSGTNTEHAISLWAENITSNTEKCDLNFWPTTIIYWTTLSMWHTTSVTWSGCQEYVELNKGYRRKRSWPNMSRHTLMEQNHEKPVTTTGVPHKLNVSQKPYCLCQLVLSTHVNTLKHSTSKSSF